jgi:hypothetical protein
MIYYFILFYIISIPLASYILLKNENDDILYEALEDFFNQIGPNKDLELE